MLVKKKKAAVIICFCKKKKKVQNRFFNVLRKITLVYLEALYIYSAMLPVGMVCKPEQLSVKLSRRRAGSCLDLCLTAAALRKNRPPYSAVTMETVAPPITGLWGHGEK